MDIPKGGLVATKVANNDDRISGIILMASPTVPMKDVINEQVAFIQKASGKTEEDIQSVLSFQKKPTKLLEQTKDGMS